MDKNIIIFDENTQYGATFNFKKDDVTNAIKLAYSGSNCEKLLGEFGKNNSDWVEVNDNLNDFEMYFYISDISQTWREMGLCAFKVGITVDTNNYIQSINFSSSGGMSTDPVISKIISYNNVFEEFYFFILYKLFDNMDIINNMNTVVTNEIDGVKAGGIGIKDNISYGYLTRVADDTSIYIKQYSVGAVGNEKAAEMINTYKGFNNGIYVELDKNKIDNSTISSNIDDEATTPNEDTVNTESNENASNNNDTSNSNTTAMTPSNNNNDSSTTTSSSTTNNSGTTTPSNNSNTEQNETKYTTVPNLVGLDYNTAINKMIESKIETGAIEKEYIYTFSSNKDNTIAEQSLKAGTKVEEWEAMEKLKIYKYSESFILEMPIKVVKKNVTNKEELLSGKQIVIKYNDVQVCVEYIDSSHFSGNDLIYKYPTPWINVNQPINSIKVDIYIGADLVKTQNISIKNLEGQKIKNSGSSVSINLDEVTIDI